MTYKNNMDLETILFNGGIFAIAALGLGSYPRLIKL